MIEEIRLTGMYGLSGLIMFIGYLLYGLEREISLIFMIGGAGLIFYIIIKEIEFKEKRHERPLLYPGYKGN